MFTKTMGNCMDGFANIERLWVCVGGIIHEYGIDDVCGVVGNLGESKVLKEASDDESRR
jgi:hypothetical protein